MSLKGISYLSVCCHFIQQSITVCTIRQRALSVKLKNNEMTTDAPAIQKVLFRRCRSNAFHQYVLH